jgi:iron complex transport system substrate-binding protein
MFLFACVFLFAACQSAETVNQTNAPTREVADDLGRKIKIPERIERVVSLAPNLTESIFAVGAGEKLVGVTTFCDYPAETEKIQKVGDTLSPNMETIIALKPQIVFVSTASQIQTFAKTLEDQNIAVFIQNPQGFEDVLSNLKQLGEILGTGEKAERLVRELQNRAAEIENRVKDKNKIKVFVQISKEPLFTVGQESFLTEILERAGGESVTKTVPTAYPKISKETALALNPEAIILSESPDNLEPNEVFKNSSAVKNGKVFKINADLLSRPAPRIVDGLEQIAKNLHPEIFK